VYVHTRIHHRPADITDGVVYVDHHARHTCAMG
jgi:hypothetical protein